jgi:hypothetical protein
MLLHRIPRFVTTKLNSARNIQRRDQLVRIHARYMTTTWKSGMDSVDQGLVCKLLSLSSDYSAATTRLSAAMTTTRRRAQLFTHSDRLLGHSTNYSTTSTLQDLETSEYVLYSWYTYLLCSWYTRRQAESSNEPPKLRKQARPWHIRVYACTNTSCTYHLRSPAPTDSTSTAKFDSNTNRPRASIFTQHYVNKGKRGYYVGADSDSVSPTKASEAFKFWIMHVRSTRSHAS